MTEMSQTTSPVTYPTFLVKSGDSLELQDGPLTVLDGSKNMVMPLREHEKIALTESIQRDGVMVPVMISMAPTRGRIIDGFNRWQICKDLGMNCPVTFREFKTEKDEDIMALALNVQRRQLDDLSAGLLNMRLLELHGITGRGKKSLSGLSVSDVAREAGQSERTFYRRIEMARLLSRQDCADIRLAYRAEEISSTEAMTLARARKKAEQDGTAPPVPRNKETLRDVVNNLKGKPQIAPLEQARMEAFTEGVKWGWEAASDQPVDPDWVLNQLTDWRQSTFEREKAEKEAAKEPEGGEQDPENADEVTD